MSEQWRGPGWWADEDGLWYPPDGEGEPADRWARRPGWIDDSTVAVAEVPTPTREGPIAAGNRIIQAATGQDERPIELSEPSLDHVIDLRPRLEEANLSAEDASERELVDATTADIVATADTVESHESGNHDSGSLAEVTEVRPVQPVSVAPPLVPPPTPEQELEPDPEPVVEVASTPAPTPIVRTAEPARPETPEPGRSRRAAVLLVLAAVLAVASGVLGALWVRERDTNAELRLELAQIQAADDATAAQIEELANQITALELRNDQLAREKAELEPLVADVPPGRLSVIDIPFDPVFVDEVRGQFLAVAASGEYVVWAGGVDSQITDFGTVAGAPTGMFAARDQAFISTVAGEVEVVSLIGGEDGAPIPTGALVGMVQDNRQFWGFEPDSGELRRYRSTNGRLTTSVALPTPVTELSVGAGAVWALGTDGMVYRINTADFTLTPIAAGQDLVAITAGPDALWTLSAADGSLRRVDAVSGEVLVTVPVGRDPIDAEFSGNSVWVALRSGSSLIEVDTRTSAVVSRTSLPAEPISVSSGETGVLVTLDAEDPLVRVASD